MEKSITNHYVFATKVCDVKMMCRDMVPYNYVSSNIFGNMSLVIFSSIYICNRKWIHYFICY